MGTKGIDSPQRLPALAVTPVALLCLSFLPWTKLAPQETSFPAGGRCIIEKDESHWKLKHLIAIPA